MQVVSKPEWVPHYCAISGRAQDPDGFVDTMNVLPFFEPRVYVSMTSARELGRLAGLVDRDAWQDLIDERAGLRERIEELEAEVAELEEFKRAVYVLKAQNFSEQGRPGRKPAKAVA